MANRRRRYGNQKPTFHTVTNYDYTNGTDAASLFKAYGATFMPSQEFELDCYLARNDGGEFASRTICVSKPRQNGKSYAARFYAIWMAAIEGKHVLYSAHHAKVVRTMFREIADFVQLNPDFNAIVKRVYRAAGQEGIYFSDDAGRIGGFIEFQTRTNSGARGETYTIIVVDEAQELTYEQLEGLKPTTLATGALDDATTSDPQMIFLGTPPNGKCMGDVFRDYHDAAHASTSGIWWIEWAAQKIPDMSDKAAVLELVYQTNPAMGYRIKEATMLDMMETMRPDGFARECLGWWSATATVTHLIAGNAWAACKTDAPPKRGLTCFACKFDAQGARGTIAACIKPEGGTPYIEIVLDTSLGAGINKFVQFLKQVAPSAAQIVIDGRSNAQTLNERLLKEGVKPSCIIRPSAYQVASACSGLVNAVKEKTVSHNGAEALALSATATKRRRIGTDGGFGFASTEKADATLIEAAALALWAASTTKRDPSRKLRIG